MSNERPEASDLLIIARQTLLRELMPHIPKSQHYPALMIANAMAIVTREIQQADTLQAGERALLSGLMDKPDLGDSEAIAALAQDCRAGLSPQREQTFRELSLEHVKRQLAVSNPKYLKAMTERE